MKTKPKVSKNPRPNIKMPLTLELLTILARLERCQNHAQVCFVFDCLPRDIQIRIRTVQENLRQEEQ